LSPLIIPWKKKKSLINIYIYFNDEINKVNCKCEKNFLEICSNEQLLLGCINIDKNNTSIKLNDNNDCKQIENFIMSQNLTLSDIFDFKYKFYSFCINWFINC